MRLFCLGAFIAIDIFIFWQWLALQHALKNCIEVREVVLNGHQELDGYQLALFGK